MVCLREESFEHQKMLCRKKGIKKKRPKVKEAILVGALCLGKFLTTLAEVTPNGGLVREFLQEYLN